MTQSTACLAAAVDPSSQIAISKQSLPHRLIFWIMESQRRRKNRGLPPRFAHTMAHEDDRRPHVDLGLGVWTKHTARYYPLDAIQSAGGVPIDNLSERGLLVYRDPATTVPSAIWSDATHAAWEGTVLHREIGQKIENGLVFDGGQPWPADTPMQMFTRWYGFAFTLPHCQIFGENQPDRIE